MSFFWRRYLNTVLFWEGEWEAEVVLFQKLSSPSSWAQLDTCRVDQAHIWACTPGYAQMWVSCCKHRPFLMPARGLVLPWGAHTLMGRSLRNRPRAGVGGGVQAPPTHTCAQVFRAAQFTVTKRWKQANVHPQTNQVWSIPPMEHYSALEKEAMPTLVPMWMKLKTLW